MKRKCTACGKLKELSKFAFKNKKKNQLRGKCKKCQNVYQRWHYRENRDYYLRKIAKNQKKHRERNRLFVNKYLSENPCVDCNETDIVVLEFDHIRGEKILEICKLIHRPVSLKKLKIEIKKCDVRCANCHKKRHAKEDNTHKYAFVA